MRPPESYQGGESERLPPIGRVGHVLFLESSPYITGETIHIDGGKIAGH
jgi:NAD(P)-dependent dehydrogenase (short-subunit alcohol dehydrogenase family)